MNAFLFILGAVVLTSLAIVVICFIKKREVPILPVAFVIMAIMVMGVYLFDIAGGLLFGLLWTLAIFVIPAVLFDEEKALACIALLFFVLLPGFGIATEIINHNNGCKDVVACLETTRCGDYCIVPTLYCSECLGERDMFVTKAPFRWKSRCIHCGGDVLKHFTMQQTKAELQHRREIEKYNHRYDWLDPVPAQ